MRIKPTSKNLARFNTEDVFALKYHDTVVLCLDRANSSITLKTGGWETMNTSVAMDIGFKELGVKAHVEYRKNKKEQGLFLNIRGERIKIEDGMKVEITPLELALYEAQ